MWAVVGLGFIWTFATSFVRIYGEAAQKVGLFVLVTFVVASGSFSGTPVAPHVAALVFLGGIAWAMVLTLGIWPIHPHGPSRRALSLVYERLSDYAAEMMELNDAPHFDAARWGAMARERRRGIREALDSARVIIAGIGRTHIGKSRRTDQQLTFLQCADQIYASIIALSDLIETRRGDLSVETPAFLDLALDEAPEILKALSKTILARDTPLAAPFDRKLRRSSEMVSVGAVGYHGEISQGDPSTELYRYLVETILSFMRGAAFAAAGGTHAKILRISAELQEATKQSWREAIVIPLRQNLNFNSISLRHALRLAVTVSIALFVSAQFALVHGYWLTMTVVLILQPYLGSTWQTTAKRIVFSSLGGILAALLSLFFHTPLGIAFIVFPLSIATMIFRTVDYGLFVMCLTPQFVLISSLADPINSDLSLAWARGFDSVLGGILTLAASALLWPSHRPGELPIELGAAIAANREYLQRLLEARGSGGVPGMVDASRRLAGLASNNAEASLERLLAEPGANPIITEATMTIVTSVRRITGSITLLSLLPAKTAAPLRERKLGSIVAWIQDSLDEMAKATKARQAPGPLRKGGELGATLEPADGEDGHDLLADLLSRVCRQIVVLHAALVRLASPISVNEEEPVGLMTDP
jgi:uncharacterized membrane protein YccC